MIHIHNDHYQSLLLMLLFFLALCLRRFFVVKICLQFLNVCRLHDATRIDRVLWKFRRFRAAKLERVRTFKKTSDFYWFNNVNKYHHTWPRSRGGEEGAVERKTILFAFSQWDNLFGTTNYLNKILLEIERATRRWRGIANAICDIMRATGILMHSEQL